MFKFKIHRSHFMRIAVFAHDIAAAGLALSIGIMLRYGIVSMDDFILPLVVFMAISGAAGYIFGLNTGIWRYASMSDIEAIFKTSTLTVLLFSLVMFFVNRLDMIPRASIVAAWGAMMLIMSGSRISYRLWRNRRALLRTDPRINVLLVGTSSIAENFLKAVVERSDLPYRVLGLIDDRDRRTGMSIRGCQVLGNAQNLEAVIQKLDKRGIAVRSLILTNPSSKHGSVAFDAIADTAKRHQLTLLRLPELKDLESQTDRSAMTPIGAGRLATATTDKAGTAQHQGTCGEPDGGRNRRGRIHRCRTVPAVIRIAAEASHPRR